MKDAYPRKRILPYVLLGMVLFCCVLTPSEWWHQVREDLFPGRRVQEAPTSSPSPMIVIEREQDPPPASITAAEVKTMPSSIEVPATSPPRRDARPHVWAPPKGWVPRPIQPLRVEPMPPVANRVVRGAGSRETLLDEPPPPSEQAESDSPYPPVPSHSPADDDLIATEDSPPVSTPSEVVPPVVRAPARQAWPAPTEVRRLMEAGWSDPKLAGRFGDLESLLNGLEGTPLTGTPHQHRTLADLKAWCEESVDFTGWSAASVSRYQRVRFAVQRRLAVWRPALAVVSTQAEHANRRRIRYRLASASRDLLTQLDRFDQSSWAEALHLNHFITMQAADSDHDRLIAESALRELQQRRARSSPEDQLPWDMLDQWSRELEDQVAASMSIPTLLQALETYGAQPSQDQSQQIVAQLQRLALKEEYQPVIDAIQLHYRNANFRVSISEDVINSFFPAFHQYQEAVRDTILGADVRGQNRTSANLTVDLIPDNTGVRMRLMARGQVHSNTASRKGPVTLFNRGRSSFTAGKEFVIRPQGVDVSTTRTSATSGNRLVNLETELDGIPFVGWMLRTMARREQEDRRTFLRAEIARRVERSAQRRMDQQVEERISAAESRFQNRLLSPLTELQLDPRAMEMRTTRDRVIVRSRLASPYQFAAHTPRPQALADSKFSAQIHQSAVNNFIQQLDWAGRRLTVGQMFKEISDSLGTQLQVPNEEHASAEVLFADRHPIEVQFEDGRISLIFHIAELRRGKRKWKNFAARGTYRTDVQKLDVELIRDDGVELISDRLRMGDQLALRGIFVKVFAKSSRLTILRKAILSQPRLQALRVTQLSIRDGWICLALGEGEKADHQVAGRRSIYRH